MRHQIKILMLSLFIFPCCAFSLNVGDHFNQYVNILNQSSQAILVTDAAEPTLQNKEVVRGDTLYVPYSADQFTVPSGQTFDHTVDIYSATDDKLICTIKTSLAIDASGAMTLSPTSTDKDKCKVRFWRASNNAYFIIDVKDESFLDYFVIFGP